ncbi:hypothetical protein PPACK8108_LOCUS8396 [Phakopsora pachyrhizi]|uniref:Uncharacterized protein n=1 Tax=Phakopsora pachyrhizi TaxID=170000 RepID=A0AAV0AY20_PHAPC|nr:hypothetical protein PPACK8108_LOCUS8396 [Phakopsora pachyrhizi]
MFAAEYVRVKVVEAVHGQAKVARVEVLEVMSGPKIDFDVHAGGEAFRGSEYGGREGVIELMWFTGGRQGSLVTIGSAAKPTEERSNWYHRGKEPGVHGPGRRLGPRVGRARAARVKQETEASIGGWQFLQGIL